MWHHEMRFVLNGSKSSKWFQKFQIVPKVPNCREVWVGVCAKAIACSSLRGGEKGKKRGGKKKGGKRKRTKTTMKF